MMKPSTKSIQRVGRFLRKTLGNIKSNICFRDYYNLTKTNTPLLSPFSTRSRLSPQDSRTEETFSVVSCDTLPAETKQESFKKQHKQKHKKVADEPFDEAKRRGDALAQKMKDLNMVDLRDVEQELDVREALRCYSSIRSPVYLDIVDNFFTDMYYEFSDPRTYATSGTLNGSRRKAGSFRL